MRIFYGGLANETNAFSPIPCTEDDFLDFNQLLGSASRDAMLAPFHAQGWNVVQGFNRIAQPAGLVQDVAYARLSAQLLAEIAATGPFDGVVLNLHGAMAAETVNDCEGDLLARMRSLVGPETFVGAVLDPHCHMTDAMRRNADMLVLYKEYPHTDIVEATAQLAAMCVRRLLAQTPAITSALFDCRQIDIYHTTESPMRELVTDLRALEREPGVLSVSIVHGFPWGDSPDLGSRVLVYTNGDEALATHKAREIGERLIGLRGQCHPATQTPMEALAIAAQSDGLTVLADFADNAGGGAASDSTFLLQALLSAAPGPSAIGAFWAPELVDAAFQAGIGHHISASLGGRHGPASGTAVRLEGEVIGLKRRHRETAPGYGGFHVEFGDVVAIRMGAVTVLLSSLRCQAFGPALFEDLGVPLSGLKLVAVKSTQHFRAGFDPFAARTLYVDTPGALTMDFAHIPYRHAPPDLWPRAGHFKGADHA